MLLSLIRKQRIWQLRKWLQRSYLETIEDGCREASGFVRWFLGRRQRLRHRPKWAAKKISSQDQAKLTAADKEAAEEAKKEEEAKQVRSCAHSELLIAPRYRKSTIDDINKDATITDKEAAIKRS